MASAAQRVEIPGSWRVLDPRHERVGDADRAKEIQITVYLRPSIAIDWVDTEAMRGPGFRSPLSREEFLASHGASEADVDTVRAFAAESGLEVSHVDQARRALSLRGAVEDVARAFGAQDIGLFQHPDHGAYRARRGPLTVPADLDGIVTGVFGIDERPQATPHLRRYGDPAQATAYSPVQVAQAYDFPPDLTGAGETVAIIELGGGYDEAELGSYFQNLLSSQPTVTGVSVDGASNAPGSDPDADGEVMLDIEVAGAVAPGANIVVYFAPNTDQGFIDAASMAVHNTTLPASVISISWGGPEDSWSEQARNQMDQIFVEGAALGVTVTVAAGDGGSTDGVRDGRQHVDFPASAPHALSCGGTSLQLENGHVPNERVWNDMPQGGASGGGISTAFPTPSYQAAVAMPTNHDTRRPGRGVPDVSGNADPATGYAVLVDGTQQTIGGTSAVAPLWAGLIALLNQSLGTPLGFVNPRLYNGSAAGAFRDITDGNNGAYFAAAGWDPCTGLGSPNGTAMHQALSGSRADSASGDAHA